MLKPTERERGQRGAAVSKRERQGLLALLLSASVLHAGALRKPFFADDFFFLEQVRHHALATVLASPDPLGNFLRPVGRQTYFWLVSRLGHESPVVFHATSLLLFLGGLLLVYALVRRLSGTTTAFMATAFLAFHYAADVPLCWASGSQDLLAVLFAVGAVYLHGSGRRGLAAATLLLGLLSKETVALTALVALVASHRPQERWGETLRRASALIAVTVGWAAWWVLTVRQRPATGQTLSLVPGDAVAAMAHLVQVALGLEFRLGGSALGHWTFVGLLVGASAAAIVWLTARIETEPTTGVGSPPGLDRRSALLRVGLTWTLAGIVPLVVVMPTWSAYYYLFALVGVGLVVAALAAALPWHSRAVVIGILAMLSANVRTLDEFAADRGAWTWQSHVNKHYLDRAMGTIDQYLQQLRQARPTLPARSTVFFANLPVSSGWQAGDGPLLRWAYRDSSLRSYYLTDFSRERAERGPLFFFTVEGDSLRDRTTDPALLPSLAYSLLVVERPRAAADAIDIAVSRTRGDSELLYWRAWARLATGDSLGAASDLAASGVRPTRSLPGGAQDLALVAIKDTAARIVRLSALRAQAGLNPWVHARLAALCLASRARLRQGVIEAYAFRVLAPEDPDAWRKWASAQLAEGQHEPALRSLERYFHLAGSTGNADREAQQVAASLRRLISGDVAQRSLRKAQAP